MADVTAKDVLDAVYALATGAGNVNISVGHEPEMVVGACMRTMRVLLDELATELSGRFEDSMAVAYSAALDGLEMDVKRVDLTITTPAPRVVRRRLIERDDNGRAIGLIDTQV